MGRGGELGQQVLRDVRWSFTPPWSWLSGVGANLVLSLIWLLGAPLTNRPHHDWAIIVGTYFAVFILADVTTTNVLGADAQRVRQGLEQHIPLRRILLVKNLSLLLIVGVPTLLATALITIASESGYRLVLTLPGVVFPILTWLGVGNLVSVALPVPYATLRQRWAQRHLLRPTVRWLVALGLPYVLLLVIAPMGRLPRLLLSEMRDLPHTAVTGGLALIVCGLFVYLVGTLAALTVARFRTLRLEF